LSDQVRKFILCRPLKFFEKVELARNIIFLIKKKLTQVRLEIFSEGFLSSKAGRAGGKRCQKKRKEKKKKKEKKRILLNDEDCLPPPYYNRTNKK